MILSEEAMIAALETEMQRFYAANWDCGMAKSPFEAGEWLIAFEELYWAAMNPEHPAATSSGMAKLKDYFERVGVDLSEIESITT